MKEGGEHAFEKERGLVPPPSPAILHAATREDVISGEKRAEEQKEMAE